MHHLGRGSHGAHPRITAPRPARFYSTVVKQDSGSDSGQTPSKTRNDRFHFERKTSPSDHRLTENDLQPFRSACGPATTAACASCGKSGMPGEMQANERVGRKRLQQGDDLDGAGASASKKKRKMIANSSKETKNWCRIYECTKCGKAFKSNSELTRHLRVHSGVPPGTRHQRRLFRPVASHREKNLTCLTASGQPGSPSSLLQPPSQMATSMHGKTPSHASAAASSSKRSRDDTDLDCPGGSGSGHGSSSRSMKRMKTKVVDGKGRIQAENKLLITSDKPFSCDTCGKAFAESGALTTHLRVHSGDKPYSCDTCGKAYSGSSSLSQHILSCC